MRVFVATIHFLLLIGTQVQCQHKSFADTKFDLDPSLPAEDVQVDVAPPTPATTAPPPPPPPPAPPVPETAPPVPETAPPTVPVPVTVPESTTVPVPVPETNVSVAPAAPRAVALPDTQPSTVDPLLPTLPAVPGAPPPLAAAATAVVSPLATLDPGTFGKSTGLKKKKRFRTHPLNKQPKRWFRRKYDLSKCPKNEGFIGQEFKKKFPKLLSHGGTDDALAGLVTTRLVACRRKKASNHWQLFQDMLEKNEKAGANTDFSPSQLLACRNGLIEEEIACQNLDSFLCQFIAPRFSFKMVPVRQIVIEARLTESGANKCRPLVDLLSKKPSR